MTFSISAPIFVIRGCMRHTAWARSPPASPDQSSPPARTRRCTPRGNARSLMHFLGGPRAQHELAKVPSFPQREIEMAGEKMEAERVGSCH